MAIAGAWATTAALPPTSACRGRARSRRWRTSASNANQPVDRDDRPSLQCRRVRETMALLIVYTYFTRSVASMISVAVAVGAALYAMLRAGW